MPEITAEYAYPNRPNAFGLFAVVFIGAAVVVEAVGAGMAFGPRQAEAGLLLLAWGGTVLGCISVALGALGVIRPGPAPSIVAMIVSLPVLSYGILHL